MTSHVGTKIPSGSPFTARKTRTSRRPTRPVWSGRAVRASPATPIAVRAWAPARPSAVPGTHAEPTASGLAGPAGGVTPRRRLAHAARRGRAPLAPARLALQLAGPG